MPLITDFIDYDAIPVEHREAVEACVVHNIVAGKDNGAFDPYGNVTYGELCKQICTIENLGTDIVGECTHETLGKYEVHHWAAPYIQLCREHGIYSKDGNTFSPDQSVIYSDVYDMLIKTYHFLTGEHLYSEYSQPSNAEVTRSGITFGLFQLCQAIGKWLSRGKGPYYIPSADNLKKFFFFTTFLPSRYSNASYVFNFALQMRYFYKNIPLEEVFDLLKYKDENLVQCKEEEQIYHFTTLNALRSLSASGAYFRLSNAEFLNDPSEGQVLMNHIPKYLQNVDTSKMNPDLKSWLSSLSTKNIYGPFRPNSTYIASFLSTDSTSSTRNLPMWYTYADNCKGCALKLSIFSDTDHRTKHPLYKVHYTSTEAESFLAGYIETLNGLWKKVCTIGATASIFFRSIALDILTQCSYLFKDESFSYENEVRAIIFCPPQNTKSEVSARDGELFPRTYCEVPFHIDHVIFGPAVPDPKRLAVGLAGMGLDCTFEKSDIPFTIV